MAAALQFLQEHKRTDYDTLAAQTEAVVDRFHTLTGKLKSTEAAWATMNDILARAKLPKMDELKKSRRELADKKKILYAEYREAVAVKANIDHLLGLTDGRETKEQER